VYLLAISKHATLKWSRLKTGSAAPLTLHFLIALFDQTFAFAILAFFFPLACVLLHVLLRSNADNPYHQAQPNYAFPDGERIVC
jgi:hypothetical protein